MKKILIFSLAYYPHVGGAEIAIKEITDRINPATVEFHMVTLRLGSEKYKEKIGNVYVYRIGLGSSYVAKTLFILQAALFARKLHQAHHFDAWWAMMSYMLLPIVLLRISGIRLPYVLTLQEGDPFEHVFERWYIKPFSFLLRSGFRHASVVQSISTFLAHWAKLQGFDGTVEIIPNGVDLRLFASPHLNSEIRKKLNIHEDETVLITSSRLVHKNAIDDIIRALVELSTTVHLLILGTGPQETKLKTLAAELGVSNRVRFLGYVPHQELPAYLQASTIFIRPSRSEGMGNSFIEAMASGIPVIATQEGGISDFLFDELHNPDKPTTGFAVDRDSPKEIARSVEMILSNPGRSNIVIENARKLVFERYDWNIIARSMQERVFSRLFI